MKMIEKLKKGIVLVGLAGILAGCSPSGIKGGRYDYRQHSDVDTITLGVGNWKRVESTNTSFMYCGHQIDEGEYAVGVADFTKGSKRDDYGITFTGDTEELSICGRVYHVLDVSAHKLVLGYEHEWEAK